MFKKIVTKFRLLVLAGALALALGGPLTASPPASAASKDAACNGFNEVLGDNCGSGAGSEEINNTVVDVINILSFVVGMISVIMIIIAGIKYVTASGDPGSLKSARNTVIYALVGILIVALAQTIVRFVVAKVVNKDAAPGITGMPI